MGIFFNNPDILYEFEVDGKKSEDVTNEDDFNTEDGGNNGGGGDTDTTQELSSEDNDDTDENDYDMEGNNEGEGNEDTENDEGDNEENDDGVNEDDYTIDDEDDEADEPDSENDEENIDGDPDTEDSSEEGDGMDNRLKDLEGELFDMLSDEQKQIKIDELKKCYQELHDRCDNIINIINNSNAPDENTSRIFEYLNDNMSDLKQYIYDYFTYTFSTKTYPENDAQCKKYIAILNSFNTILEELIKKKEEDK